MWLPFLNWLVLMMVDQPLLEPNLNVVLCMALDHDSGRRAALDGIAFQRRAQVDPCLDRS